MHEYTISVKPMDIQQQAIEIETTTSQEDINDIVYNLIDEGYTLEEISINDQQLFFCQTTGNYQTSSEAWIGDRPIVHDPEF